MTTNANAPISNPIMMIAKDEELSTVLFLHKVMAERLDLPQSIDFMFTQHLVRQRYQLLVFPIGLSQSMKEKLPLREWQLKKQPVALMQVVWVALVYASAKTRERRAKRLRTWTRSICYIILKIIDRTTIFIEMWPSFGQK